MWGSIYGDELGRLGAARHRGAVGDPRAAPRRRHAGAHLRGPLPRPRPRRAARSVGGPPRARGQLQGARGPHRGGGRGHRGGRGGPPPRGALGAAAAPAASRPRRLGLRCGRRRRGGAHRHVGGGHPVGAEPVHEPRPGLLDSRILRAVDDVLPPIPSVFAGVERFLSTNGFPVVFEGLPPQTAAPVSLPSDSVGTRRGGAGRGVDGPDRRGRVRRDPGGIGLRGGARPRRHQRARGGRDPVPRRHRRQRPPRHQRRPLRPPARHRRAAGTRAWTTPSCPSTPPWSARGTTGVVLGYPGGGRSLTARQGRCGRRLRGHRARHLRQRPDHARGVPARRRRPTGQLGRSPGGVGRVRAWPTGP